MEDFKENVNVTGEAVKESVKQGAANFLDDAALLKHSVDEVADDRQAAKEAKKAERKAKFDEAVSVLKESIAQGGEEFMSDGAVLLDSLKEIAGDAGIEIKEDPAVSEAYNTVKESIEQGFENFKSDMNITKTSIEEVEADYKADKAAKKAEREAKFNETVAAVKESVEQGSEAFASDMAITKGSIEEVAAENKAAKEAKKAERREKFDETVDELKKSLE